MLADLFVSKKSKVSEIIESAMAKIHDNIKAEVVKTVTETFGDTIPSSYCDFKKD